MPWHKVGVTSKKKTESHTNGSSLAFAELYLLLGSILSQFDFELFGTTEKDIEPVYDGFAPMPWKDSKGVRVIVK